MFTESVRQTVSPIVALIIVFMGFGMAILLESEVLLAVVVILPYLVGVWLIRIHYLRLTRQCLATYLQMHKPLKR